MPSVSHGKISKPCLQVELVGWLYDVNLFFLSQLVIAADGASNSLIVRVPRSNCSLTSRAHATSMTKVLHGVRAIGPSASDTSGSRVEK